MLIPKEVKSILGLLSQNGYEAYIVGGCVRDFLRGVEPEDWDITTSARPEEIQKLFPKSFYSNKFFTVTVFSEFGKETSKAKPRTEAQSASGVGVEITTYRKEAKYTDKRHPDKIEFAKTLEEDLARRDFTVNAIALGLKSQIPKSKFQTNSKFQIPNSKLILIDPFNGQRDLENKIIRAVGESEERFSEDALRMLRAVRFSVSLGEGWKIEEKTSEAIKKNSPLLRAISKERIRDEFLKIIMADRAAEGVDILRNLGLLKFIIPELQENYGVGQNKHHIYDCYTHALKSLEFAAKKKFELDVRLAALFHDIGKPRTKKGEGKDSTFYNHEVVGAKMVFQILSRLKFPKKQVEKITKLVRYHLFYYNVGEVGESSVRRLVKNVGAEDMEELLQLRQADRIGSGVPKAEPYKLRHLKYIIEKVAKDPVSVKMIKVSGNDVMEILGIKPGPKIGQVLDVLLGYVLDDPQRNKRKLLIGEIKKLGKLSDKELEKLAKRAREEKTEVQIKEDEMTKKKYWVT